MKKSNATKEKEARQAILFPVLDTIAIEDLLDYLISEANWNIEYNEQFIVSLQKEISNYYPPCKYDNQRAIKWYKSCIKEAQKIITLVQQISKQHEKIKELETQG
jgi:hypothetical protein